MRRVSVNVLTPKMAFLILHRTLSIWPFKVDAYFPLALVFSFRAEVKFAIGCENK